jgi:hypothetical protein
MDLRNVLSATLEGLLEGASTPDFEDSPSIAHARNLCDNCKFDLDYPQSDLTLLSQGEESNSSMVPSVLSTPSDQTQTLPPFEPIPTKIKALVTNLSKHYPSEKWEESPTLFSLTPSSTGTLTRCSVVFSSLPS